MSERKMQPRQLLPYWGMWIASAILSLADWWVLRMAVTAVATWIAVAVPVQRQIERQWYLRWPAATVDKFALVCFGILALLSIIGFEALYRDGLIRGKARKRFTTVTVVQGSLLLVSLLVNVIVGWLVA